MMRSNFFILLNVGSGVGKSTLIKTVYRSVLRFHISLPGSNPDVIRVAVCPSSGKVVASVDKMILHLFLSLPINRCKHKLVQISSDVSNKIGVKLRDLQLLIIDEISMVGFAMFQQVDARLQQIVRSQKPFGRVSVIVFRRFQPTKTS